MALKGIAAALIFGDNSGGGGGGSTNYNDLTNKPMINGEVLEGDKPADDFDLLSESDEFTEEQINDLITLI